MPKYYCDYCKSYLTHDTMSVRKSHLMGKNHIRFYCDYYEMKAKETGIWDPSELPYEITSSYLNRNAPGSLSKTKDDEDIMIPPPPTLTNFPQPPPSVLRHTEEYQKAIAKHTRGQN